MKILLEVPEAWESRRDGDWHLITSPDGEIRVLASPLTIPAGGDPRRVFERDIPLGFRAEYTGALEAERTRAGWPMTMMYLRLLDPAGHGHERRIGVAYKMLAYVGAIVVRAPSESALLKHDSTMLALLRSARPHLWGATPSCLDELFLREAP